MRKTPSDYDSDPHFSDPYRPQFTLEPLRSDGPDALDTQGFDSIGKVVLREYEISYPNALHEVIIRRSDNLFSCVGTKAWPELIASAGTLVSASFDVYLTGYDKPVSLRIRPPDALLLDPPCNPAQLFGWMLKIGFMARILVIFAVAGLSVFSASLDIVDDEDDHHLAALCGGGLDRRS